MTLKLTLSGMPDRDHKPRCKRNEDEGNGLYNGRGSVIPCLTAMRFLGEIREAKDPTAQSEIITDTQMLLTAFVLDLKPLPEDQTNPSTFGTHPIQMVKLDA